MKKRILIADRYEDSADAIAIMFKIAGNDVCIAKNGSEAITMAEEFKPDLVLLDLAMPEVNGYDVCRHIRQQSWAANVILVAVTGWSADEFKDLAMESGFDHFFPKPVDIETLEQLLAGMLKREKESDQESSINPPTG